MGEKDSLATGAVDLRKREVELTVDLEIFYITPGGKSANGSRTGRISGPGR